MIKGIKGLVHKCSGQYDKNWVGKKTPHELIEMIMVAFLLVHFLLVELLEESSLVNDCKMSRE